MGGLFSYDTRAQNDKRIWPTRYFHQVQTPSDMEASRFGMWDPKRYMEDFKYPAKEPAKDF